MGDWRARARSDARDAIIDAATEVFAAKGLHGATLDEIAKAAGYTAPALYRYFANKKALYLAMLERIVEGFGALIDEAPPIALPFEDRLRWVLARLFQHAEARRHQFTALAAHNVHHDREMSGDLGDHAREREARFTARWVALLSEGVAAGALRDDLPVRDIAVALGGMLQAVIFQWLHSPEPEPLAEKVEPLAALFLGGARRMSTEDP